MIPVFCKAIVAFSFRKRKLRTFCVFPKRRHNSYCVQGKFTHSICSLESLVNTLAGKNSIAFETNSLKKKGLRFVNHRSHSSNECPFTVVRCCDTILLEYHTTKAAPFSIQQKFEWYYCARGRWKFQIGYISARSELP